MKSIEAILLLLLLSSFTLGSRAQDEEKVRSQFSTTVDGKTFKLREVDLLRGLLMTKAASIDGKTEARTVVSVTFNGAGYDLPDGRLFNESVQFEISYEPEKLGPSSDFAMALQYKGSNYYITKDLSKLDIYKFEWEDDKKHFILSADYDCKLRSWGAPADGKQDVTVKGSFSNIRITVPSWLAIKN